MDPWTLTDLRVDDEITLRRFSPDDAAKVFETVTRNADHLGEYMHWMVPDYSLVMAEEFIARSIVAADAKESLGFGIFRGESLLGSIGFVFFDYIAMKTEIGYWVGRSDQGKGIVSRAAKVLIDFAFDEFKMNRMEIRCSALNERSAAIPRRYGFKLEGILRQSELRNGKLHDFLVFGLLRSEWRTEEKRLGRNS